MFVRSYLGVVVALIPCTLCTYLLVSGHYDSAQPWLEVCWSRSSRLYSFESG
jgi:thiosulfate reductase cytochrome b subunit